MTEAIPKMTSAPDFQSVVASSFFPEEQGASRNEQFGDWFAYFALQTASRSA